MRRRLLPILLMIVALAGFVVTVVWAWWLVSSRPRITGFSDHQETCFAVHETPNGGLHNHPRRQYDDQARLNGLAANDDLDVPRLTDDCERARTARVALLAGAAVPTGLVLLTAAVASGVGLTRALPRRDPRLSPQLRDPVSIQRPADDPSGADPFRPDPG